MNYSDFNNIERLFLKIVKNNNFSWKKIEVFFILFIYELFPSEIETEFDKYIEISYGKEPDVNCAAFHSLLLKIIYIKNNVTSANDKSIYLENLVKQLF